MREGTRCRTCDFARACDSAGCRQPRGRRVMTKRCRWAPRDEPRKAQRPPRARRERGHGAPGPLHGTAAGGALRGNPTRVTASVSPVPRAAGHAFPGGARVSVGRERSLPSPRSGQPGSGPGASGRLRNRAPVSPLNAAQPQTSRHAVEGAINPRVARSRAIKEPRN